MSQRVRFVPAAAALLLQFAVLYVPRAPAVDAGGLPLDKAAHILVFALPTYALIRAGLPTRTVVLLMGAQAVASELVQHLRMPNRSGDVGDVLADVAGIGIAVLLVRRPPRPASPRSGARNHRAAPS